FANVLGQAIGAADGAGRGVEVAEVTTDRSAQRRVYDPGHPDADAQGYVSLPNVNPVSEMVDLISASRAYEANVTAMNAAKQMFSKTLELLRSCRSIPPPRSPGRSGRSAARRCRAPRRPRRAAASARCSRTRSSR